MRTRTLLTVAVITLGLVMAGCNLWKRIKGSDEEAPIIVKNGSIHLETKAKWTPDGRDWINDTPANQVHGGELWVKVMSKAKPCPVTAGHPVIIQYSDLSVQAHFNPGGNPTRTRVQVTGRWNRDDAQHLSSGTTGDLGHITGVRVGSSDLSSCDFTAGQLDAIEVCSSEAACR
jgi:hypothetical protein